MLIYVRGKRGVEKKKVVKLIKIEFTLFDKKKKLVLFAFTNFAANKIGRSTIYTAIRVDNRAKKNYQVKTFIQWLYCLCGIILLFFYLYWLILVNLHSMI